ncbi:hypothetical protein SHIRM173S_11268 [Streptomyces hirsutus]
MFRRADAPPQGADDYACQTDGMIGLGCGARSYTAGLHYSFDYAVGMHEIRGIIDDYVSRPAADFAHAEYGRTMSADEARRRHLIQSLLQRQPRHRRLPDPVRQHAPGRLRHRTVPVRRARLAGGRRPARPVDAADPGRARPLRRGAPGPPGRGTTCRVRDVGAPGIVPGGRVQRGPHRRDQPGRLRVPRRPGHHGPLFLGADTHALSEPARVTALEVFAANGVTVLIDSANGYTPTPAVSHAILTHNRGRTTGLADGVVVTPSHNPPADGGFKYNPPSGGPAGSEATGWIQDRANEIIRGGLEDVRRIPYARALTAPGTGRYDFLGTYVADLPSVLDLEAIRTAGVRIGADPLGGASVDYWGRIAEQHGIDLTVVNPLTDPTWRFMTLDWDGKIRMDCSSPHAMASLIERRDRFDIATGNDADADRHQHRHPGRRPDEPEPLPRHGHPVPLRAPRAVARRGRCRQDAGVLRDDRPGSRRSEARTGRGARRLRVVRRRTGGRHPRLRR